MRKRTRRWWLLLPLLAIVVLIAGHTIWFPWLGSYLVHAQPPAKADGIVVLAGDFSGHRVISGAELAKAGYAPLVIVSGPFNLYGQNESDLAIEYAVSKGYDKALFRSIRHEADNTREESVTLCGHLRRSGLNSILLVTSDFHTRRAGTVFRKVCEGMDIRVVAAQDNTFLPDSWWRSRRMAKTFLLEWMKTVAYWFGI